jgi:hypothetical protein
MKSLLLKLTSTTFLSNLKFRSNVSTNMVSNQSMDSFVQGPNDSVVLLEGGIKFSNKLVSNLNSTTTALSNLNGRILSKIRNATHSTLSDADSVVAKCGSTHSESVDNLSLSQSMDEPCSELFYFWGDRGSIDSGRLVELNFSDPSISSSLEGAAEFYSQAAQSAPVIQAAVDGCASFINLI